jgi:hypothetical protein
MFVIRLYFILVTLYILSTYALDEMNMAQTVLNVLDFGAIGDVDLSTMIHKSDSERHFSSQEHFGILLQ